MPKSKDIKTSLHKFFDPLPKGGSSYQTGFSRPCGIASGRKGEVAICETADDATGVGGPVKVWLSMEDFLAQKSPVIIGGKAQQDNPWGYIYSAEAVAFDAFGNLFVADNWGNRVLMFHAPLSDGMNASCVLGQKDFFYPHKYPNQGTGDKEPGDPGPDRLYYPRGLAVDSKGNLFVADDYNHRVLRFKRFADAAAPFANGQGADLVLGQPDFYSNAAGQLSSPKAVAIDNADNLYVADWSHGQVLCWSPPYQPTPTKTVVNMEGSHPVDLAIRAWGGQLLVTLQTEQAVKAFENPQDSFTLAKWAHSYYGPGTDRIGPEPLGVASDANNVLVADYRNNRVLIVRRD